MIPLSSRVLRAANEYDPELWKRVRDDIPVSLLMPDGGIEVVNKLNLDVRDSMIKLFEFMMEFQDTVKKVLEDWR